MVIPRLNDKNFDEFLRDNDTFLVDFYATWCGPCKIMAPIVEEIAEEHPELAVAKCDVDEAGMLAARYGIMSIPTIMIFKNGNPEHVFIGVRPKEEITSALA